MEHLEVESNQVTKTRNKHMLLVTFPVFLTRDAAISAWTIICCSLLVVLEKKNLLVGLEVCKTLLVLGGSIF